MMSQCQVRHVGICHILSVNISVGIVTIITKTKAKHEILLCLLVPEENILLYKLLHYFNAIYQFNNINLRRKT